MPWSTHLYIGQPVTSLDQARAILTKLEVTHSNGTRCIPIDKAVDEDFDNAFGKQVVVEYKGKSFTVWLGYEAEYEGEFTHAVSFCLTSRYRGSVLDADERHGKPDQYVIDIDGAAEVLRQVRTWWPEAQIFMWDRHS